MQAATGGYARGMCRLDAQSSQSQNSDPHVSDSHEGEKQPRTERGRRTMRKLIDAAEVEFAENGFHQASIVGITRRAGVALGSFYTYFDTKEAIFRARALEIIEKFSHLLKQQMRTRLMLAEPASPPLLRFPPLWLMGVLVCSIDPGRRGLCPNRCLGRMSKGSAPQTPSP